MPRLTFVSIRSRSTVFTDGPAHVALWPFTASIFWVVKGEASCIDADITPFVLAEVHAAKLKQAQIRPLSNVFFIVVSSQLQARRYARSFPLCSSCRQST